MIDAWMWMGFILTLKEVSTDVLQDKFSLDDFIVNYVKNNLDWLPESRLNFFFYYAKQFCFSLSVYHTFNFCNSPFFSINVLVCFLPSVLVFLYSCAFMFYCSCDFLFISSCILLLLFCFCSLAFFVDVLFGFLVPMLF